MSAANDALTRQIEEEESAIAQATDDYIRGQAEEALKAARAARSAGRPGDALVQLWMAKTWAGMLNRR